MVIMRKPRSKEDAESMVQAGLFWLKQNGYPTDVSSLPPLKRSYKAHFMYDNHTFARVDLDLSDSALLKRLNELFKEEASGMLFVRELPFDTTLDDKVYGLKGFFNPDLAGFKYDPPSKEKIIEWIDRIRLLQKDAENV